MHDIGIYGLAFLFGTMKFLIAASLVSASALSPFQIALATGAGALTSFNVFYRSAGYFMRRSKEKQLLAVQNGTYTPKKVFSKINKFMVKLKLSKSGFWVLCIFGPLFLSIPVGSIVLAKFYNNRASTPVLAMFFIVVWAFVLAYLNQVIFGWFR
jgi:hypothetical protein